MSNTTSGIFHKLFALILILAGGLLLLHNVGVLNLGPVSFWEMFWPSVFILYGFKLVLESLFEHRKSGNMNWFWGICLILLGVLLLLGHFDIITFRLASIWQLWPLIIVYIGLSTLFTKKISKDRWKHEGHWHQWHDNGQEEQSFSAGPFHVNVGKVKRREVNWSAEPTELTNGIGEYEFDYTQAFIPEEEIPVRLTGWIGDIKIIVPRDVEFAAKVRAFVGDIYVAGQNKEGISPALIYKTPGYDEAVRKLTFDIDYRILDLRIDHI